MASSGGKVTVGYWYSLGLHFAICQGPIDALRTILAGERIAWQGYQGDSGEIEIDAEDLFGGKKREGGIKGDADVMMGEADQLPNEYLSDQIEGLMPAFRGIMGVVYKGGRIAANNPYVKPWAFEVTRINNGWDGGVGWYLDTATIPRPGADEIVYPVALQENWEDFEDDYELTEGSNYFDRVDTPYGDGVRNEANCGGGNGVVSRDLDEELTPCRVQVKFIMPFIGENSDDDANRLALTLEGVPVFQFNPRREISQDASQRAHVLFLNPPTFAIGSVALSENVWYQFDIRWNPNSTEWFAEVSEIESGTVVASSQGTEENFIGVVDGIQMRVDPVIEGEQCTVETIYTDLILSGCAPGAPDMNPAHIVYQGLTDAVWGMGYPVADIDEDSFTAAADAFAEEGLGLSLVWNQQSNIESFIQDVLDHAGAVLYVSPRTGKFNLKLIRADYDPDELPVYDESNIVSVDNFQRAGYGETINEITVVYRNQAKNRDESITVQDLANITAQGGVVSQTVQYPGFSNSETAGRAAERDLVALSTPLAKATIQVNRSAWEEAPGGVIKFSWDKLGVTSIIMRVLAINYGKLDDGRLVIDLAEDVFGLPASTYSEQEPTEHEEPDITPQIIVIQDVLEAPYWDIARALGPADLALLDANAGYVATLASSDNGIELGYTIYTRIGDSAGSFTYQEVSRATFVPTATVAALVRREDVTIAYENGIDINEVVIGQRALIGTGRLAEWVEITAINEIASTIQVNRGILDTTPQIHQVGARIFFADDGGIGRDPTERATADDVEVKLTAFSGGGEVEPVRATPLNIVLDQRAYRPYPPGKIRINGESFPSLIDDPLSIAFAHRDRLQQTAYYVTQDEDSIGPEAGTTYNGYVYDDDTDTLITSATGITSPWTPTVSVITNIRIEIESERDGVVSWQRQVRELLYGVAARITEENEPRVTEDDVLRAQE